MARKPLRPISDFPSFLQPDEEVKGEAKSSNEPKCSYVLHRRSTFVFPRSSRFASFPSDPLYGFPVLGLRDIHSPKIYVDADRFTRVFAHTVKDALIQINESSPFRRGNSSQIFRDIPSTTPSSEGAFSMPFALELRSQQQISETEESGSKQGSASPGSPAVTELTKALRDQIVAVHRDYASAREDEWHLHSITPASSVDLADSQEEAISERVLEEQDFYDDSVASREMDEGEEKNSTISEREIFPPSPLHSPKDISIHASKPQCDLKQVPPKVLISHSIVYLSTFIEGPSHLNVRVESPNIDSPLYRKLVFCEEHTSTRVIESRETELQVQQADITWVSACSGFSFSPKIEFSNVQNHTCGRLQYDQEAQHLFFRLATPGLIRDLVRLEVRWVSSGFEHNAVVTTEGLVYTWGYGSSGCLGHGDTNSSIAPRLVETLKSKPVTYLECGGYHTAAVASDGALYTWGRADVHQLGLNFSNLYKDDLGYVALVPYLVDSFHKRGVRIKAVACGEAHTLALDAEGLVYAFGWAEDGQLGVPVSELKDGQMTQKIRQVRALQQTRVIKIAAGALFSSALTESGQIFMWGNGEQGQLGLGSRMVRTDFPTLLTHLRDEVVLDVVCGENYVTCVAQSGKVWGWGQGLAGHFENKQFVQGSDLACFVPRPLSQLEIDHKILIPRCKSRKTMGEGGTFGTRLVEQLANLKDEQSA